MPPLPLPPTHPTLVGASDVIDVKRETTVCSGSRAREKSPAGALQATRGGKANISPFLWSCHWNISSRANAEWNQSKVKSQQRCLARCQWRAEGAWGSFRRPLRRVHAMWDMRQLACSENKLVHRRWTFLCVPSSASPNRCEGHCSCWLRATRCPLSEIAMLAPAFSQLASQPASGGCLFVAPQAVFVTEQRGCASRRAPCHAWRAAQARYASGDVLKRLSSKLA